MNANFPENEEPFHPGTAVFPAVEEFARRSGEMNKPIMAKATAVWLVDNTTLTFKQIADFCGLHELEVQGIADGDVATGVKGFDPIQNNQLEQIEITQSSGW